MEKQKNIPELRFPSFGDGWATTTLKDIAAKITDGTHDTPKPVENGIPYLTAIHVQNGYVDYENCYYLPQNEHDKIYKRCNPEINDLLLVNIGAGTANCAINTAEYEFSLKNVALIKPNKRHVYPSFLEQSQRYNRDRLFRKLTTGGAQPFLSLKEIGRIKVLIPTLPEQQKIASFFTAIDKKISQLKQKKTLLEQYKKGVMQKIFSQEIRFRDDNGQEFPKWEKKMFGQVYSFRVTNSFSRDNLNYETGDVKNIHYGDIHTKFATLFDITQEDVPYVNADISMSKISNENYCKTNDLVFADASEDVQDVGKCTEIVILNDEQVVAGLHTILARPDRAEIANGFGGYLMMSHDVRMQIMKISQGSKVTSISSTRLKDIDLSLPCPAEQLKIASFLSTLDIKINHTHTQIEKAELWKKGLLQKMFV